MSLLKDFPNRIEEFIKAANKQELKMILVGGGAVNFHGFQRHSADLDFWIDIQHENMEKLLCVLNELGYDLKKLPDEVINGEQNISIKISPVFDLELITKFDPQKTFNEAFETSDMINNKGLIFRVLSFEDLIQSKIASTRPKDKLDVEELHKIQLRKNK